MSLNENSSSEMVPASCHYALQVVVESLKNRCQRYQERIETLEKEKIRSDEALYVAMIDNSDLRRLLSDSFREKEQLQGLVSSLVGTNDDEKCSGSVHTDSSSSVELISDSSSLETIISQEEPISMESSRTAMETSGEGHQDAFDVQRALAQAVENKRALYRQMDLLEELVAFLRRTQQPTIRPQQKGSDCSSLDSFEIIGNN